MPWSSGDIQICRARNAPGRNNRKYRRAPQVASRIWRLRAFAPIVAPVHAPALCGRSVRRGYDESMKLRRIQIVGFKSFKDKVTIELSDDMNGIVGPNGCGKSNVVDALKWAMGDMSAKSLRGAALSDVIFAGSQNHRGAGIDRKSTRLNSSHVRISYAVFCLKKKT